MFDDAGRPQGYGQYSPFTDQPSAPGAQADPNAIPGAGAGTPSHPVDPTLNGWRGGQGSARQLGQPHLPLSPGLPPSGGPTPLQNAIQPSSQAAGGLGTSQNNYGAVTDASGHVTNGINPIDGTPLGPNQHSSISGPYSFGTDSTTSHLLNQPSTFAAGSDQQRTRDLLTKYKSTDDPTYWDKVETEHGGFDATGQDWLDDAIRRGDGAEGVRNGSVQKRGANKSNHTIMSAIAPGFQSSPVDPSLGQTGSSNPLLAAIRQSLMQKAQ